MKTECLVVDCEQERALVSTADFSFHWVSIKQLQGGNSVEPGAVIWLELATAGSELETPFDVRDGSSSDRDAAFGKPAWRTSGSGVIELSRAPVIRQRTRRHVPAWSWVSVAAVLLLALVVAWPTWGHDVYLEAARWYYARDHVVLALDINPSVELYVDSRDRVTHGLGLNEDGRGVLYGMAFGIPIENFVQKLVVRLEQDGYLSRQRVALMVGLAGDDGQLRERVALALQAMLGDRPVDVLLIVDDLDDSSWQAARRGGLSVNRLRLRQTVQARLGEAPGGFDDLALVNQLEVAGMYGPHVGRNVKQGTPVMREPGESSDTGVDDVIPPADGSRYNWRMGEDAGPGPGEGDDGQQLGEPSTDPGMGEGYGSGEGTATGGDGTQLGPVDGQPQGPGDQPEPGAGTEQPGPGQDPGGTMEPGGNGSGERGTRGGGERRP